MLFHSFLCSACTHECAGQRRQVACRSFQKRARDFTLVVGKVTSLVELDRNGHFTACPHPTQLFSFSDILKGQQCWCCGEEFVRL